MKKKKKGIAQGFLDGSQKEPGAFYIDLLYRGPGCGFFLGNPGILSGYAAFR